MTYHYPFYFLSLLAVVGTGLGIVGVVAAIMERRERRHGKSEAEKRLISSLGELEALRTTVGCVVDVMSFSARDWSQSSDLAWLWQIVIGWQEGLPELARKFG